MARGVTITEVEATLMPRDDVLSEPQLLRLPFRWDQHAQGQDGAVHFKASLPALGAVPDGPRAIYLTRIGNRFEVRLNGTLVSAPLSSQSAQLDLAKSPRLIPIPQAELRGNDVLEIMIQAQALRRGGLSVIRFGTATELEREFALAYDWRIKGSIVVVCASVVLGMFALLLWLQQRAQLFLLYAMAELAWAIRVSDVLIEQPPLSWPSWGVLVAMAYALYVGLMARLSMLVLDWQRAWLRTAWHVYLLGAAIACFAAFGAGYIVFWTVWLGLMLGLSIVCTVHAAIVAGRTHRFDHALLGVALLISCAIGIRDWAHVWLNPEAFGDASWVRYASLLFGITIAWIIADRYGRAQRELSALNQTLADRVAERESQLVASFERTKHALQEAASLSERQRLMRDMHDGLGSRLTGALSVLRKNRSSDAAALEYITEALEELKLTVDSLQDYAGDLATVLGHLRYRLQDRLKAAGVTLLWQVEPLPPLQGLTPTTVRSIQNLILEAIANAMKHSAATQITLAARPDSDTSHARILIEDNGQGFEPGRRRVGRGLALMEQRARDLGGEATITSRPTQGCRVELRLPYSLGGNASNQDSDNTNA